MKLLRRKLALERRGVVRARRAGARARGATVVYMTTGDAPLQGGAQTVALVVAGMLATFGVNHLRRRRAAAAAAAAKG